MMSGIVTSSPSSFSRALALALGVRFPFADDLDLDSFAILIDGGL